MILSRIIIATFLLGSLLFFDYRYHIYNIRSAQLLYFGTTLYFLSFFYWYLLKSSSRFPIFAYIQIGSDILLISWLVTLTGVIDSGFSILYHVVIISASIILYRRGGYFAASFTSILYGSMLDFQYYGLFGYAHSQSYAGFQILYLSFVNILSFYLVAFLSGYLSERLRSTRQELREKSSDFDDLRVLQDNILRSVGSGIVTLDMSGSITSWNQAAEQITGYSLEDIRNHWNDVFGQSIKGLFGHTDDLRERPIRFEGSIARKDGARLILGFTASLLRDDEEVVRGIILTFQDITKLIEMEELMRRQERLATVGSLAAGIAHEIRNPLASLSGSIQLLRESIVLSQDNKNLMDIVLRETDRLNAIITGFLDYAKPKTTQREKVSLASLLQETIMLFKNSKSYRENIRVISEVEPSIDVIGDPKRLRQVFWNLLINSAQALAAEGGTVTIRSNAQSEKSQGIISINFHDTGPGISAEDLDKIFDPFFTTKSDGTGLGLAIVYRIMEDHGGGIYVSSEPGKGTTFSLQFPRESSLHREAAQKSYSAARKSDYA